jgi:hypothetical protein
MGYASQGLTQLASVAFAGLLLASAASPAPAQTTDFEPATVKHLAQCLVKNFTDSIYSDAGQRTYEGCDFFEFSTHDQEQIMAVAQKDILQEYLRRGLPLY